MIGLSSRSAGVLLIPRSETDGYSVLDVIEGKEQDPVEAQYLYSTVQDWVEIKGANKEDLLATAIQEYWLARTVSLLREVIGGLESSLEKRVLEHVEEILGSRDFSEKVLDRLLVAPLINPRSPLAAAKSALSYGFAAVASILDELAELQPLLHRLTDLWLGLAETAFSHFEESKEMIWATVVENCGIKQLLKTGNRNDFAAQWNLLAFKFTTPRSRIGVGILGKTISHRLFPSEEQAKIMVAPFMEDIESEASDDEERVVSVHKTFTRVEKQIAAIAQAVSEGRDTRADKFLRELIRDQTSSTGGESYAVKSLCNIAKRCADMFRMDFEVICLDKARRLNPFDAWTLIQYGDHLKRVGNYDEALRVFDQAKKFGENDIASSSVADVYSQQGDYAKAILAYEAIPNWSDKAEVRTAIADNLRRMGRMEDAQKAYSELVNLAQQGLLEFVGSNIRAQAGIAEIAKKQGKLEETLRIYEEILKQETDERTRIVYRLSLCNILKLMERFDQAYKVVDEVIQEYPFAMEARFIRGSILGLIGQENKGLEDLPESSGCRSWREWLRRYYRGLLLLKLERYGDAKKNLVEELNKAVASGEDKAILCMAASLWYLREDKTLEVDKIMSNIPELYDCHIQYLSLVLKLHSATLKKDLATMDSLKKRIAGLEVVDTGLEKAVVALNKGNFSLALTCEIDALLKLAA